jgi:hypothetical protein
MGGRGMAMNREAALKIAIGIAAAAVIVTIEYAVLGYDHHPLGPQDIEHRGWEAVRIRTELPDADFLYVLTTCPSCHAANDHVKELEQTHPKLKFVWVHPNMVKLPVLMDILGDSYGMPETERRLERPVLYGPERLWQGVKQVRTARIEGTLNGPRPYERLGSSWDWLRQGHADVLALLQRFQWYAVGLFGLIDGINPCAISTIIFLLSYLTLAGLKRDSLKVGLLFALGCFVSYFLIGLGLWHVSTMAVGATWGRRILYPLIAFVTIMVSVLAFVEFSTLLRGVDAETVLKLPRDWLLGVHEAIRRFVKARHVLALAAPVGVLVTLIEFGCTGQVYLPTITYVASLPGQRLLAVPLLLVYNIAFIIPLLAVIIGHQVTAGKLAKPRPPVQLKLVRLAEGILLGAIGAFMLWATFQAWTT